MKLIKIETQRKEDRERFIQGVTRLLRENQLLNSREMSTRKLHPTTQQNENKTNNRKRSWMSAESQTRYEFRMNDS